MLEWLENNKNKTGDLKLALSFLGMDLDMLKQVVEYSFIRCFKQRMIDRVAKSQHRP